jgi:hypothetical protein
MSGVRFVTTTRSPTTFPDLGRLEELQQANMNTSTETCRAQFSKALDSAVKALR